jgi:tripartite-type tricarboxylate transporter receptor subunit TctC
MNASRRRLSLGLAAASLGVGPNLSWAQSFPSKALKIIVPFPAGGTTDVVARMVAQRMSESMGQPVVVENRGGAGGAIGADAVAKAAPDGHTLLMHNLTFPMTSVAQTLAGRSAFNVETDLIGVSISVYVPFMWTAHPSVPAKDLRELGQLLRAQKLPYNYGSTGPGSAMHVLGEAFKKAAGVERSNM